MTRFGKVSCGFVAFELREREREEKEVKQQSSQEIGIFLQYEESSLQADMGGCCGSCGDVWQAGLLSHSLAFLILPSTPFGVFFLNEAGSKTEGQDQKEP